MCVCVCVKEYVCLTAWLCACGLYSGYPVGAVSPGTLGPGTPARAAPTIARERELGGGAIQMFHTKSHYTAWRPHEINFINAHRNAEHTLTTNLLATQHATHTHTQTGDVKCYTLL